MPMPSEFDPIRHAPLPDSFGRTSDWLRAVPPKRQRRFPAAILIALAVGVAAWSWPVDVTERAGVVVEAMSSDRVEAGHAALLLLGRLAGSERRHLVELEALGDDWESGTVVRYAFSGDSPVGASVWRDSLASVPGVRRVRVVPIETRQRRALGIQALHRLLRLDASDTLTDGALRSELDRLFARSNPPSSRSGLDTTRIIRLGDRMTIRSSPGVTVYRSARAGGAGESLFLTSDSSRRSDGQRVFVSIQRTRGSNVNVPIDSLSPEAARMLRDRLDALIKRSAKPGEAGSGVLRIYRLDADTDSSRVPLSRLR